MDALDNGLIVCRLAKTIQEQAQQAVEEGRAKGVSIILLSYAFCLFKKMKFTVNMIIKMVEI